ncbi:hypothetical protein N0V90_003500 [Kalmusia sp. IMI 367209]|nr:hypothetical protein N0V90_003500 [Kalmusia sp. IMI 367209]
MSLPQILAEGVFAKLPVLVNADTCSGRTYIVTGGNHGLGLETARHLVRSQAARVILTVRNNKAGEEAKTDIERSTGRKGVIDLWHLDLASFDSVKAFANKLSSEVERIDAFVANAGVQMDRWETAEGNELSMTVNVISTVLLSVLIMPKLVEIAKKFNNSPKLVYTGSALGFVAEKELAKSGETDIFKGLNDQKRADMDQSHGRLLSGCKVKEYWVPKWMTDAAGRKLQKQIWSELVDMMEKEQPSCVSKLSSRIDGTSV